MTIIHQLKGRKQTVTACHELHGGYIVEYFDAFLWNRKKMKIYFHQFTDKVGDKWAFSFAILPDIEFYWLGGLKTIYIGWLVWDIMIDFRKE